MSISKRTRFRIFQRDSFTCQYCGVTGQNAVLEVDHRVPRCRGGTDDDGNLVTACYACNRGKCDALLMREWEYSVGPHPDEGPLYKQKVQRCEQYPVSWVYQFSSGEFVTFDDELVAERVEKWPYEDRLRYGPPWQSQRSEDVRKWHECYSTRDEYPKLLGLYVAVSSSPEPERLVMAWYPPADALTFLAIAIPPAQEPDD